eukprot:CAMPEP_0177620746 /NCGR_PEP_ID=MMETSP0419_2-20121207/27119_1 /TAXON_ID=582737 /ORGANISM="Tetraselmis sp., Strain GSL018" /LENGTH=73 /DNA_ID=CAMNT_0019120423 /DNA_START=399 /DNA_END=616 /DNA_ORIENTATION=+
MSIITRTALLCVAAALFLLRSQAAEPDPSADCGTRAKLALSSAAAAAGRLAAAAGRLASAAGPMLARLSSACW